MDFLTRRSIRKYQDRELEKEVIEELMKTAVVSPSGKNGRPYEFIVVTDKEKIKKLAITTHPFRFVVCLFDRRAGNRVLTLK